MTYTLSQVTRDMNELFNTLRAEFQSGFLLFGGPLDIFISVLDVLVTAFGIYYLLRILADSRAWQLLKGLILIFVFTQVFGLLGLRTTSFIMVNSISILTFGLVVLFQPELRRTLETVGRNSFKVFSGVNSDGTQEISSLHNFIESIAVACSKMAETYTGALIIIERKTSLGELLNAGSAVLLDSALTSTALQQVFYKGSPLHDGAVLIRQGRLYAARVHVPLSDNYHMRRDYGTRHRAAVGASEIGDAIGIVVSEERGAISLTVGGRLYNMEDVDALRTVLHRLLAPETEQEDTSTVQTIRNRIKRVLPGGKRRAQTDKDQPGARERRQKEGLPRKRLMYLRAISLAIALLVWFYVQVVTNPIRTRTFTVPLQTLNVESLWEHDLSYTKTDNTVTVVIKARESTMDSIGTEQVDASIDFSEITEPASLINIDVKVDVEGISELTYEVVSRSPHQVPVLITEVGDSQVNPDDPAEEIPQTP